MRVKQWKYFWSWALMSALLLAFGATCVLYFKPRIYGGTLLAQLQEIYPGEDLTHPNPPDGVTVRKIEGTHLVEVRGLDPEPDTAADLANDFYNSWLRQRLDLSRFEISARQMELEYRGAEWVKLELQRRNLPSGGIVHVPATSSDKPVYPKIEAALGLTFPLSAAAGMVLAFFLTRLRGEQPDDGAILGAAEIGKRFAKIAPVLCGLFVMISMILFVQQPRTYRSATTLEFLPHDPETFLTQLEILKSRAPIRDVVKSEDLVEALAVFNVDDAVDELLENLEISGDREKSIAVIKFDSYNQDLAELLPSSIANAFITRGVEIANSEVARRSEELESAAWLYSDTPLLVAEAKAEIARLSGAGNTKAIAKISAIASSKSLPRNWIGWLRDSAAIEIVRGCIWGLVATFISLLFFNRFGEKQKTSTQAFAPGEPKTGTVFGRALSPDPY